MITGINQSKILAKHIYASVNVNMMIENVIEIKSGIMVNVGVSVKSPKTSCVLKRLYLESCYMLLQKKFSKSY